MDESRRVWRRGSAKHTSGRTHLQLWRGHGTRTRVTQKLKEACPRAFLRCYGRSTLPRRPTPPLNSTTLAVNTPINVEHISVGMPLVILIYHSCLETKLICTMCQGERAFKCRDPVSGKAHVSTPHGGSVGGHRGAPGLGGL